MFNKKEMEISEDEKNILKEYEKKDKELIEALHNTYNSEKRNPLLTH